ncbi:MAG TPA: TlpA disulfide reductase family protein [bacterium]|nr:TlpA disulfide reductase family protein [bacterium]
MRRSPVLWSVAVGAVMGLLVVAVWTGVEWALHATRPSGAPPASSLLGRRAPDLALQRLDGGGVLDLRSFHGRPLVINFWASWCGPCREETPLLARMSQIYGPRGIAFVGVDAEDEPNAARGFALRYHVDYPLAIAPDDRPLRLYGIIGLPTTVFVGPDGIVRAADVGGFIGPEGERALAVRLDRLLQAPR